MGKIHEFYRRHSVGAPVATILALWGFIERILDWVGLVDQARSMMDPHHWFTQVISWPHFDLIISGIGFLLLLYLIAKDKRSDVPASTTIAPPSGALIEPKPNLRIGEAMDYLADRLGLTSEQDIEKKYTHPARLLTLQAIAGKIHVWGKRISSDGPELVSREIPAEEWRNRELLIWASLPFTVRPQTRSIIDLPSAYELTDLHVNATEIKAINWLWGNASTSSYDYITSGLRNNKSSPPLSSSGTENEHEVFDRALDIAVLTKDTAPDYLTRLRKEGIGIRDSASELYYNGTFDDWSHKVHEWKNDVAQALKAISPADSEWFSTLDVVPPARVPAPNVRLRKGQKHRISDHI